MYFKMKAKKLLCAEQELEVQGFGDHKSLILTETTLPHKITFLCARSLIPKCLTDGHKIMSIYLDLVICI